jgi:low affinity Fe/Cu permease
MEKLFRTLATRASWTAGQPVTFLVAISIVIIWAVSGPLFNFSNTWQLFINTGTTVVTFLMVFLIQNTQNRDSMAVHIKLDELIKAIRGARNTMVNIEELSDQELEALQNEFRTLHEKSYKELIRRKGGIEIKTSTDITGTK